MITGSHNPPNYNGFKMVLGGAAIYGDQIQAFRKRIEAKKFIAGQGSRSEFDIFPLYLERIVGDVKLARPMKIAVDCGNGIGGAFAGKLFKALGCEVKNSFCEVDGHFPNHHPDPAHLENLQDLIMNLQTTDNELGLAFDGDADRLGIVTKDGQVIFPDRQMMLFAKDVLSRNPGGQIIYDVKCTRNLATYVKQHGGEPLMWKTGHSLVKAKLKETGAPLAGEMSGHIFFKDRWFGFDDGLYTGARLLEILSKEKNLTRHSMIYLMQSAHRNCNWLAPKVSHLLYWIPLKLMPSSPPLNPLIRLMACVWNMLMVLGSLDHQTPLQ